MITEFPTIKWHLETRKIKDLKPHPKNPRKLSKHDGDNLIKSISEDGLIDKPSIDLNNQIIGGHQRLSVLKKMGHKEVEVWVPSRDLTSKEVDRINLRLNRVHGDWDFDILSSNFDDDMLLDGGFSKEEICVDKIEEEEMSMGEGKEDNSEGSSSSEKKKNICPACAHEF